LNVLDLFSGIGGFSLGLFGHCHDCNKFVCDWCDGSGFRTIHGGGSGDPEWDADDQPCSECNDNYSRVADPQSAKTEKHG
jgi:hypothetical protein